MTTAGMPNESVKSTHIRPVKSDPAKIKFFHNSATAGGPVG